MQCRFLECKRLCAYPKKSGQGAGRSPNSVEGILFLPGTAKSPISLRGALEQMAVARTILREVVCALALATPAFASAQTIPAFSGADGAAANVTGGRGGLVYHVTKLDKNYSDSVPGTLRYGLNGANFGNQPRTIVFDVAGTFWLGRYGAENGHDNGWDTNSRYNLGSDVTVAGHTAPGPVYIMGGLVKASGNNAIIRNVTIAPGYGMRNFSKPEDGVFPTPGDFPDSYVYDAIDITGTNLMIDHVSTVYSTDETISANELANNVSIQYSNISQGQNYPQADAEASSITYTGHALGSLLQGGSNSKFSVHHNLYAHQKGRLPRVGSEVGTGAYNDFRNNVFYNWLGTGGSGASSQPSFNNFVGNFWRAGNGGDNVSQTAGPDGINGNLDDIGIVVQSGGGTGIFSGSNSSGTRVYHSNNLKDTNKDVDANDGVALANGDFGSSSFQASAQWSGGTVTYNGVTDSATGAYNRVLDYMGANWWNRDALDTRIVNEVRTGTGKIKAWADDPFNNDPNEGMEWRSLLALRADPVTGAAPIVRAASWDTDGDGMPGNWEVAHNLNPAVAENNGDFDMDGYTNLEEYMNEIAAWPAPAAIVFNGATNTRYAQITNWDVNSDPTRTHNWQPSKFDTAHLRTGTTVVDAVGQHAGTLAVAPTAGDNATLNVTAGWLDVAAALNVGAAGTGVVNHTAGAVAAQSVTLGGSGAASGTYNLSGSGALRVITLARGATGGAFNLTGGTLSADVVAFDLVNNGGTIAPGSSPGITHVQGNLTLNSGALAIELAGTGAGEFDEVHVDGNLTAGGMLSVTLLDNFAPAAGNTFDILDFTSASGAFAFNLPALASGLSWDTSSLLTTGALSVVAVLTPSADFNGDEIVDGQDLLVWQRGLGLSAQTGIANGDANRDGTVDADDLLVWKNQFGTNPAALASAGNVPEPASATFVAIALASLRTLRRKRRVA
jgi:hypothetical protein